MPRINGNNRLVSPLSAAALVVAFGLAVILTGCRVGPNFRTPQAPIADNWKTLSDTRIKGEPADTREWWKVFNDPVLNGLIDQASRDNLSLHAAGLRIIQSRLVRAASVWTFFPVAPLSGEVSHYHFSRNVKPDVTLKKGSVDFNRRLGGALSEALKRNVDVHLPDVTITPSMDMYRAGVDAIWEMDVWGKDQRRIESATGELSASIADYDNVLVMLTGEIAMSYIEIRTLQQELQITRDNVAILERVAGVVGERRDKNIVTDLDADLAATLLNDTKAEIPSLEAALAQAENGLCVLLGKPPYHIADELGVSGRIPEAPKDIAIGAPADLLRRRPDVRAAEQLAAAQSARIGLAKSFLYPSFSLFGSLGLASSKSELFFRDNSVRGAYGALFGWNILLYPVLQDNVRLQDATFQESVANYKQTVLTAAKEVENAATTFVKAQDRLPLRTESAQASRRAIQRAIDQYKVGVTPFATVVNSAQFLVQNTDRAAQAQGEVALALVATYKALGGGWQIREGKEVIPEETKKQMRKETDWWTFEGPRMLTTKKLLTPKE